MLAGFASLLQRAGSARTFCSSAFNLATVPQGDALTPQIRQARRAALLAIGCSLGDGVHAAPNELGGERFWHNEIRLSRLASAPLLQARAPTRRTNIRFLFPFPKPPCPHRLSSNT
jgi:hypothetical protein